jgi:hypothetical protein
MKREAGCHKCQRTFDRSVPDKGFIGWCPWCAVELQWLVREPTIVLDSPREVTPLAVMIAVHYAVCADEFRTINNKPQQEIVRDFIRQGLLIDLGEVVMHQRYRGTDKLRAWVKLMQQTPVPKLKSAFVDVRNNKEIEL